MVAARVLAVAVLVSLTTASSAHPGVAEHATPVVIVGLGSHGGLADQGASVLETIQEKLRIQLGDRKGQSVDAFVAFLIGLMLIVVDCRAVFKWFGIGCVVLFSTLLAMSEVEARWPLGFQNGAAPVIGAEVGLAAGYVALKGYQGLMVIVGAILGAFLAHLTQSACFHFGGYEGFHADKAATILLYTVFVMAGIHMIRTKGRLAILAYVTPFIGGALVSSAVFWFIIKTQTTGGIVVPPWADFLVLLGSGKAEEGVFISEDRSYGLAGWFILFVLGAFRQHAISKKQKD